MSIEQLMDIASNMEYSEITERDEIPPEDIEKVHAPKPEPEEAQDDEPVSNDDQPDEQESSDEEEGTDEADEDADEEEAGEVLLTLDNKELKLPKGTPPEVVEALKGMEKSLRADYTKKTTEVAEQRKTLEAEKAATRAEVLEESSRELFKYAAVFEKTNPLTSREEIKRLMTVDPAQAMAADLRNRELLDEHRALMEQANRFDAEAKEKREAAKALRSKEAWVKLREEGFKDEGDVLGVFRKAIENYGMSEEAFADITDAPWVVMMRDANKWRNLQERNKTTKAVVDKVVANTASRSTKQPNPSVNRQRDNQGQFKKTTYTQAELANRVSSFFGT